MAGQVASEPAAAVRFGLLGPLQVVDGAGTAWAVPAAKQRIVLATLLLSSGGVVSAAGLAEAMWDASPPPNAPTVMRTYVSRLRRVLGSVGTRITGQPPGWAVELHGLEEFDVAEVDGLWRAAQGAGGAGEWGQVSSLLARALSLWRGDPLVDIPSASLARREASRLAELRLQLTEARIDADLRLGRHSELAAELRRLAAEHPLREHLRVQLMLACYRCGHQGAALEVYRDARATLAEELGVDPGPELREMHQKILAADPGLTAAVPARLTIGQTDDDDPQQPVPRQLPSAVGHFTGRAAELRRLTEVAEEARADGTAAISMIAGMPGVGKGLGMACPFLPVFQLPAAPADFTGRMAESGRLMGAITPGQDQMGVPLAVVSGPPGAGKTSLTLHVAHAVRARFPDGQLWVHLAGTSARPRDPCEVLGEFLRALGVPGSQIPPDLAERAACYRSFLAGRRVLLVADDAAGVGQVRPLQPGTGGCAMVVTSRARLEGLDGAYLMPLEVMTAEDAVGLLARIVGDDRVAAERAAAGSLAQACGALPLALRIAGAKLATRPSWPLSVMVRKITGAHDRLRELESADLSVRASIASSYQSLAEHPRRAFRLLALLGPADFAEWMVGALLGETDAAGVISELTDQSLLTPAAVDPAGEPRYRLHDLLREFAAECLADEPVASKDAALHRALEGWLQLSIMANARLPPEPYFPPPPARSLPAIVAAGTAERVTADPVAWFTAERVNLLAAVEQACEAGFLDLAQELASRQCAFQHYQDRYDDAERQWRLVAESASHADDPAAAAYASLRVGASMIRSGQAADALAILDRCIEANGHSGEPGALAFALYWRSSCALNLDDPESARSDAKRGIAVARWTGSRVPEFMNLSMLGVALACLREEDQAVQASESALAIAADLGAASYELEALHNLAYTYTLTGRHEPAVTACLRGIELGQTLGDICGEGLAQGMLGDAYHGLGKYQKAAASLHRALPVFRDHSARHFQAVCLLKLGYTYEAMGSPEATGYLEESLEIFRQLRLPVRADRAQQALDRCKRRASG